MSRSVLTSFLFFSSFALVIAGCGKLTNQRASSNAASSSSDASSPSAASSSSSPSRDDSSRREAEARQMPIVVRADTWIAVVLDDTVGSKISETGQTFTATVESPVEVDGRVVIPKGARATGVVKDAKAAGRFKGGAALELQLTALTLHDKDYEIETSAYDETSKGKGKRTAEMVGGGAGGGAAIGAVAGGGKGAVIGALIGAAAGTGGAGLTGNRDITLPAETRLNFRLVRPLEIRSR